MSEQPPSKGEKKKVVFFTKASNFDKIEKNKPIPNGMIMYGDLNDDLLGLLNQKLDYIFNPILKQATKDWPDLL